VAKASEIFAERWTPLIVRELLAGPRRFSQLQRGMPLCSRTLLAQRLVELERVGLVERRPLPRGYEYMPTQACEELRDVVMMLGEWGQRWQRSMFEPGDLDPRLIMHALQTFARVEGMPEARTVVQFDLTDAPAKLRRWWLVLDRPETDLCLKDPGFGTDLVLRGTTQTFARLHMVELTARKAIASGEVAAEGPRRLVRTIDDWLGVSLFAGVASAG
jgi:DNA-binding HxlR family transcriptional regulator